MDITHTTRPDTPAPDINAFKEAASKGDKIYLNGNELIVLGSGKTPQGRKIDWVTPTGDATAAFNQALTDAIGPRLSRVIAQELNLSAAPGKPLSARTIETAVSMATEGKRTMEGVNFLTLMSFSAVTDGKEFIEICKGLGIDTNQLSQDQRHQIDNSMQQKVANAPNSDNTPASHEQIKQWLVEIIQASF